MVYIITTVVAKVTKFSSIIPAFNVTISILCNSESELCNDTVLYVHVRGQKRACEWMCVCVTERERVRQRDRQTEAQVPETKRNLELLTNYLTNSFASLRLKLHTARNHIRRAACQLYLKCSCNNKFVKPTIIGVTRMNSMTLTLCCLPDELTDLTQRFITSLQLETFK